MNNRIRFFIVFAGFILLQLLPTDRIRFTGDAMGGNDPSDPDGRLAWELERHADPSTGLIPAGIRQRELAFAATLPKNFQRSINFSLIGPKELGGRTRALAFDVRDQNILLAGGVTSGIWRSTDAGAHFERVSDIGDLNSISCIVQDKRAGHEDTWYAGTGEYYGVVSGTEFTSQMSGNGIYKSTDNGLSWSLLSSTTSNTPQTMYRNGDMDFVWKIVVDPTAAGNSTVLAAVFNGIFRSTDGGTSWQPVLGFDSTTTANSDYTDIIVTPGGVFYAALSSDGPTKGIWRSVDGVNWNSIQSGFPTTYRRIAMAYNPSNENEVMCVMESPSSGTNGHSLFKYTYVSGNGSGSGGVWENRSANLPAGSCTGFFDFDFGYFQTQGGYDMHINWHPSNSNIVFLGGTNLYRSNDQFTSPVYKWVGGYRCNQSNLAQYVYPNHHPDLHGMVFLDSLRAMTMSDGGVHLSTNVLADSVHWISLNNGYVTSQFYTVSIEEGNAYNDITLGGAQDNGIWFTKFRHIDSLWKWVYRGDGSYTGIPNGRPHWIFSIQQGKMYKMIMTDDGDTILGTRIDPVGIAATNNFINCFVLDPSNTNRLYMITRNAKIWRNDSLGTIPVIGDIYNRITHGWTEITQSTLTLSQGNITVCAISPANPGRVYYGSNKSHVLKLDQAAGPTPVKTAISASIFPPNSYVSSIGTNEFDGDELLVTFSNYGIRSVFHTPDAGVTWDDVSGNLEEFPDGSGNGPAVYWSLIYPSAPEKIYLVGTSVGLYSTNQLNGINTIWQQEAPGVIGNSIVNMIKARASDGKMVVATHGNGIFSAQLTPLFLSSPELKSAELHFATYPNPFAEAITIDLYLPSEGKLDVRVFDISGREIRVIYSGTSGSGEQRLIWQREDANGREIASGTYVLSVAHNGKRLTRKLIVR
ncbi:MAG TPA: hypothetical protein DCD96_01450 [Flavobacteriales bacterium]|nr:hypothetical protein [Flavobacteriales bacterium]HRE74181.1 T9SS type A sorting domain-containing protein [Flavobacteriales bacterium]HRJ35147.1 T9SS type A sorting domain-containing protein [Flavobacteriales bacterium]